MSRLSSRLLAVLALLGPLLVLAPVAALVVAALVSVGELQLGLSIPRTVAVTIALAAGSALLAAVLGTIAAWLVEACEFPGRRLLGFAIFLPFAIPPYLLAFIWTDLVDDSGLLPAGYGLRNIYGACMLMALVLYPYVYMFARAAFAQRSHSLIAASRILGCTPLQAFFRVALPMARPAIAVGALLVFMETANDIAVAADFGIGTLGFRIYDVWLNRDDRALASMLSVLLLVVAFALLLLETSQRRRQRQYQKNARTFSSDLRYRLTGPRKFAATAYCTSLLAVAFAIPVAWLLVKMIRVGFKGFADALAALGDTLVIVCAVIGASFALGLLLVAVRSRLGGLSRVLVRLSMVGYAIPGTAYALGGIFVATFCANIVERIFGWSIHWLWSTSIFLLVLALTTRFVIIACGAIESGMAAIPPKLPAVARNAGSGLLELVLRVYAPMMRPALLAGALLLAVDVIKELPLTLILRPFGTDTLALQIFQHASDEDLGRAAPAAMLMVMLTALLVGVAYRWITPAWYRYQARSDGGG